MTAGQTLIAECHENTMSEAVHGAKRPEQALEDLLGSAFKAWARLARVLNKINIVTAEEIVDDETWARKKEVIGTTVTTVADNSELIILEAEREILRQEGDITMAAKEIGKLSREQTEKRLSYTEFDAISCFLD